MSFEQTIIDLYQEIADIKRLLCSQESLSLKAQGILTETSIIPIGLNSRYLLLESSNEYAISRYLDGLNGEYDDYIYQGFGSISQNIVVSSIRYGLPFEYIRKKKASFEIKKNVFSIAIVPSVGSTINYSIYGA